MKLMVFYFMMIVFLPNTSLNASTFTVRKTDDPAVLGHYAWAHAIHCWLMDDIPTMAARIQLWYKGKYTTTAYLKGYAIALNI